MTSEKIKELLKENKKKENEALERIDYNLLIEAFREYDHLFNKLLKTQQREVLGC